MSYEFFLLFLLADAQCALHDAWHLLGLIAIARTADARHPLLSCFAVGRQDLRNPSGIVVAYIAEVAGHGEDEVVS